MYVGFNTVPLYMRSDESVMTQRFQVIVALLMSMFLGKTLTLLSLSGPERNHEYFVVLLQVL